MPTRTNSVATLMKLSSAKIGPLCLVVFALLVTACEKSDNLASADHVVAGPKQQQGAETTLSSNDEIQDLKNQIAELSKLLSKGTTPANAKAALENLRKQAESLNTDNATKALIQAQIDALAEVLGTGSGTNKEETATDFRFYLTGQPSTATKTSTATLYVLVADSYKYQVLPGDVSCPVVASPTWVNPWISAANSIDINVNPSNATNGLYDNDYTLCVTGKLAEKVSTYVYRYTWHYDTQPPAAFTITGPISPGSTATVTWTAATGASSYLLNLGTNSSCTVNRMGPFTATSNQYTLTGFTQSTYYVCVEATDPAGNTTLASNNGTFQFSLDTSSPTATGIPVGPVTISATPPYSINWTWTEATDNLAVDHYEVRVGTASGSDNVLRAYNVGLPYNSPSTTSFKFSYSNIALPSGGAVLAAGGTYYLAVRAVDTSGNNGPWTETSSTTTIDFTFNVTGAPGANTSSTAFNVTVGGSAAFYSYLKQTGAVTCPTSSSASYSTWTTASTPITAAIGADGSYTLCIAAKSYSGALSSSVFEQQFIKDSTPPGGFTITTPANSSARTTTVSWTNSSGASSYSIKLGTNGSSCATAAAGPYTTTTTSYSITAPTDSIYDICVTAYDDAGNGTNATPVSVSFDSTPPSAPGTPSNSTGLYSASTTLTFNWTAASDGTGSGVSAYLVQIGTAPNTFNVANVTLGNVLTYTISGLNAGQTYYTRVAAKDAANNTSSWSASSTGTLIDNSVTTAATALAIRADSAIGSVVTQSASPTVYFTWTAGADNESGLRGDYSIKIYTQAACAGTATTINSITDNYYEWTATSGADGVTHSFQVITWDNAGNSLSSACSSGSVKFDFTAPPALTTFSGSSGTKFGDISLSITYPASTTDYARVVIRRISGSSAPASNCTSNGSTIRTITSPFVSGTVTDANLTGGSAYSYRACVYDAAGNLTSSNTATNITASTTASHLIFVTSSAISPATQVSGQSRPGTWFDDVCNNLASLAGINYTFKAVISADRANANTRIAIHGPVYNMAGQTVASNRSGFWSGTLTNAVGYDETGLASTAWVYTGSNADGSLYASQNCSDWSVSNTARIGVANATNSTWLSASSPGDCVYGRALYCVSTWPILSEPTFTATTPSSGNNGDVALSLTYPADVSKYSSLEIRRAAGLTTPDPDCNGGTVVTTISSFTGSATVNLTDATATTGGVYSYRVCLTTTDGNRYSTKIVSGAVAKGNYHMLFFTSTTYTGDLGGLTGADAKCVARASAAGLNVNGNTTWKAILSSSTQSAYYRITTLGPIINALSNTIVSNPANYWSVSSMTGNHGYTELGVAYVSTSYWSGSTIGGLLGGSTCNDWTVGTSALSGTRGDGPQYTNATNFFAVGTQLCNTTLPLACISQSNTSDIAALTAVKGVAGATGTIDISITQPATVTNYAQIDLRRWAAGTVSEDCSTGTLAASWTSGFSSNAVINYTDTPGAGTFSYRVCVTDIWGYKFSSKYVNRVDSKGSVSHTLFATSSLYDGNLGGIAGADAKCQTAANNGGLAGTYKAILSTDTESARYRVTLLGALFTSNNNMLFSSPSNFWSNTYAGLSYRRVSEFPATSSGSASVWTGGLTKASRSCSNWTSNSSAITNTYTGDLNQNGSVSLYFTSGGSIACNATYSLLCVSQTDTPNLSTLSATAGAATNDTNITVGFPGNTSAYRMVQIRRKPGLTAPSEDCGLSGDGVTPTDSSTVVKTYNTGTGFTSETFTVSAEGFYSYRACVFDNDGFILSKIAEKILAKGSLVVVNTSTTYTGNLGGLSGADTACTARMNAAGFAGSYKAVLSSSTVDLSTRLTSTGPVFVASGDKLFTNLTNFFSATTVGGKSSADIWNDIGTANGSTGHFVTWASSLASGARYTSTIGNFCQDWTSALSTEVGYRNWGDGTTTHYWVPGGLYGVTSACNSQFSLSCISQ